MAFGVEGTLEAFRHVAAAHIACRRHCLGCLEAAGTRATYEVQFCFAIGAEGIERFDNTLDEGGVEPIVRKSLPFDQHRTLADLG